MDFVRSAVSATKLQEIEQGMQNAYAESLQSALQPLADRYQSAYKKLLDSLQNHQNELTRRISSAYSSFNERIGSVSSGSTHVGSTVEAYNGYAAKVGEYYNAARWAEAIAPAQKELDEALRRAEGRDDAAQLMQKAADTYYKALEKLLQDDPAKAEVTGAQSDYAEQLKLLMQDVGKGWQDALEALKESLETAVVQTGDAHKPNRALEQYAKEVTALGEEVAQTYRAAAEAARKYWQDAWSDESASAASGRASSSPLGTAPDAAGTASRAAEMAVSAATMPRASWVNVPEPPTKAWAPGSTKGGESGEPGQAEGEAAKPREKRENAGDSVKPETGSTGPKGGRGSSPGKSGGTGKTS
jgi:hypothetical protein